MARRWGIGARLSAALVKEVIDVDIDELVADEHRHDRSEREERTERHGGLAAGARRPCGR